MRRYRSAGSGSLNTTLYLWTAERPEQISAAGRVLERNTDVVVRGLTEVTGGPLEYERRISKAWSAFHAQGARFTSKRLSWGHDGNVGLAMPLLSWHLEVGATTRSSLDATVIRNAMGMCNFEGEGCLSWRARTLRDK